VEKARQRIFSSVPKPYTRADNLCRPIDFKIGTKRELLRKRTDGKLV